MNVMALLNSVMTSGSFKSQIGKVERLAHKGQKVRVYRNLNKPEFYSIQACDGEDKNKVIGYAKCILLSNVSFKVSEASRQRVIRDGRKNVHGFVVGILEDASQTVLPSPQGLEATYNPYAFGYFFDRSTHNEVDPTYEQGVLQGANVYLI